MNMNLLSHLFLQVVNWLGWEKKLYEFCWRLSARPEGIIFRTILQFSLEPGSRVESSL